MHAWTHTCSIIIQNIILFLSHKMWFAGTILCLHLWCNFLECQIPFLLKKRYPATIFPSLPQCLFSFFFLQEAHKSSSLHTLGLLTEAPGGSLLSLFATHCAVILFHLQPRSISSIHSEVWDLKDSTGKQRDLYDTSYCFRLSLILHKTCSFEACIEPAAYIPISRDSWSLLV